MEHVDHVGWLNASYTELCSCTTGIDNYANSNKKVTAAILVLQTIAWVCRVPG